MVTAPSSSSRLFAAAQSCLDVDWIFACALIAFLFASPSRAVEKNADTGWPMYNGSYAGDRFSTLSQITRANVNSLKVLGRYSLPETTSFQAAPLIVGDRLFVTTATSTYAINATNGELLWSHKYEPKSMGLGTGIRGAAYSNGHLYRGTPDAHLIAFDAMTGKLLWDTAAFDRAKGEYIAAAPIVWEGRIYLGNAGSDVGAIGHIRAFDERDGRQVWNFDVVPFTGAAGDTWPVDPNKVRAGGGMYSSYALDTTDGSLFSPTGNPGPDFAGPYRPGDNLYTSSVLRLDARTGALRGHYQFAKHDVHDWDVAASPILFTSRAGNKMVAVGAKNGYLYWLTAVDADSGKILWKYHSSQPLVAAITPTAGGIVFTGDLDGNLLAFDSTSGKVLLKTLTGGPIGGGISTYMIGGKQYVAVAAGMKNEIMKTDSGPAEVVIYALGAH